MALSTLPQSSVVACGRARALPLASPTRPVRRSAPSVANLIPGADFPVSAIGGELNAAKQKEAANRKAGLFEPLVVHSVPAAAGEESLSLGAQLDSAKDLWHSFGTLC